MRTLQLGPRCNNACIFCANAADRAPSEQEQVDALHAVAPTDVLVLVGGEPTLRDDLPALVREAKQRGVTRVVLRTNARRLAYASYAKELAMAGVDGLEVGLHGSSAAMHDYHTNVPGSFAQTIRGVSHAVEAGMRVAVSCVVTRSNFRHLAELVQRGKTLGVAVVRFRSPDLTGRTAVARERIVAHPELVVPHLRRAREQGRRLGVAVMIDPTLMLVAGEADQAGGRTGASELGASAKANPARAEARGRERKSGDDLRDILPALFDPKERAR
jgi:MoaA/NifB/PqqE/SkfB family radical SAM enzyme